MYHAIQTRVTTKYSIEPARSRARKIAKSQDETTTTTTATTTGGSDSVAAASAKPPRAKLILKTFDPHSGTCLKYKTSKAAEVGRLIQMLGSTARKMAALPDLPAPALVDEGDGAAAGTATPPVAVGQQGAGMVAGAAAAAGGGGEAGKGKKKKKGKR